MPGQSQDSGGSSIPISQLPEYLQANAADFDQLSKYLKEVDAAYAGLESFKWQGLDNLGYWEIQSAGIACQTYERIYDKDEPAGVFSSGAKWIALNTVIPSSDRVKTIKISLNYCRDAAVKINPRNFYSKVLSSGEGNYDKSEKEWRELCKGLDSSLKSALYLATTMEKTSNFAGVAESFEKAGNSTRDRYLGKFNDQSKQFENLLAALISKLNLAESTAVKMAGTGDKKQE